MRLLLVEDERELADLVRTKLAGDGFAVDVAASSGEAQSALRSASYDAVILDLRLPDGDPADIVGEQPVQRSFGVRTGHDELAHVGNVKQPDALPDREMFGEDAGVLHWHVPAAERHHLRAQRHVRGV